MSGKFLIGLAALCTFGFSGSAMAEDEHASWGYSGMESAAHWGETCKTGVKQSPVNIAQYAEDELPRLQFAYHAAPLQVVNNGHAVQVNIEPGSSLSIGGKVYDLLQIHFHTPSEHYLDGAPYPMEAHFVHKAKDGELAVVGVMIKLGEENPVIQDIWNNIPEAGQTKDVEGKTLTGTSLMPIRQGYYAYDGSLTTPPCSEGVKWHVMKKPIEISREQLAAFQAIYPLNARPVQAQGDRVVKGD